MKPRFEGLGPGSLSLALAAAGLEKLRAAAHSDVVVVGGGPAGLTAAWLAAEKGLRVVLVERRLGLGGGMRGGAALLPAGLVEEGEAAGLLSRAGVRLRPSGLDGLYVFDPVEASVKLAARAIDAGVLVLAGWHVEDLIVSDGAVRGVAVNLEVIAEAGWHVDPVFLEARAVVDATGHDAALVEALRRRGFPIEVKGPGPVDVWRGEEAVVEASGEVFPGLYVAGMAAAAARGSPRMGPVFGGMLLSAKKVAEELAVRLGSRG